jgi:hypothetical protein
MDPVPIPSVLPAVAPDGNDVRVHPGSSAIQGESVLKVSPIDRDHLIAGIINDSVSPSSCSFHASLDGGLNWSQLFFPIPVGFGFDAAADPAAAIGPGGEVYYCAIAYDTAFAFSTLYVGRSDDLGLSVASWVPAVVSQFDTFEDKQFLAADPTGGPLDGAVYMTWTRVSNSLTEFQINMVASFDQGVNWTTPRTVSESLLCQGSAPAVGPNGEIYVAWLELTAPGTIQFDKSLDGGLTFGTDVDVATISAFQGLPNGTFRSFSFPSIAADKSGGPHHGNIYIVWPAAPNDADVFLSRSTDGGNNWSTPIVVNDDGTTNAQFFPWVEVDPNGNVNVGFQDRRDDPADRHIAYYVARSSDGGVTFQPNVLVSDVTFDPNTYGQGGWIGDYTHIAASDRTVHGIWTDGRSGNNNVQSSRVQLDFYAQEETLSALTGGRVDFTLNPGPKYAGASYRVLGSASGNAPGMDFGGGLVLPLNFDPLVLFTLTQANSPAFPGFAGSLDGTGSATAALDTQGPFDPSFAGITLSFALLVGSPFEFGSNFHSVELTP